MTPPRTLSPSKVSTFTKCALAFRYSAIDKLPEPPSEAATKGTLVHAALERLFALEPQQRTRAAATECLAEAAEAIRVDPEFTGLELDAVAKAHFFADAEVLVDKYFQLEDPTTIRPIGLEIMLEVPRDGYALRGIIDRLELDEHGGLVVTDYKTGRAPSERFAHGRMDGVNIYATMCEELFGRRPSKVQLLYLRDPVAVVATPTEGSLRGLGARSTRCGTRSNGRAPPTTSGPARASSATGVASERTVPPTAACCSSDQPTRSPPDERRPGRLGRQVRRHDRRVVRATARPTRSRSGLRDRVARRRLEPRLDDPHHGTGAAWRRRPPPSAPPTRPRSWPSRSSSTRASSAFSRGAAPATVPSSPSDCANP